MIFKFYVTPSSESNSRGILTWAVSVLVNIAVEKISLWPDIADIRPTTDEPQQIPIINPSKNSSHWSNAPVTRIKYQII